MAVGLGTTFMHRSHRQRRRIDGRQGAKTRREDARAIELAACLGNQFDLQTLATVYEKSLSETASGSVASPHRGVRFPLGDAYTLGGLDIQGLFDEVSVEYKLPMTVSSKRRIP